jgi:hypothetical protein
MAKHFVASVQREEVVAVERRYFLLPLRRLKKVKKVRG